jgi:hypothetical protein
MGWSYENWGKSSGEPWRLSTQKESRSDWLERRLDDGKRRRGCCRPKPPDGSRQETREPGGPESLSVGPAARTRPEVEVHWACHLTYT